MKPASHVRFAKGNLKERNISKVMKYEFTPKNQASYLIVRFAAINPTSHMKSIGTEHAPTVT